MGSSLTESNQKKSKKCNIIQIVCTPRPERDSNWIPLAQDEVYNIMWSSLSVTYVGFPPGTLVSSTNKTDRHDIAEILLKVALNTIKSNKIKVNCL